MNVLRKALDLIGVSDQLVMPDGSGSKTKEPSKEEDYPSDSSHYRETPLGVPIRIVDAADIVLNYKESNIPYIPLLGMDGFIVKGWSHIMAAYPKTGKTELISSWIDTLEDDKVLCFTEEIGQAG